MSMMRVPRPARMLRRASIAQANRISAGELRTIAKKFYEDVWSKGQMELMNEIMADDHVQDDVIWSTSKVLGREAQGRGIEFYRDAYPDIQFKVENIWPSEDEQIVSVEWSASGTQLGSVQGRPPTGRASNFRGVSILQIQDGKISQTRVYRQPPEDELAYLVHRMAKSRAETP